MHGEDVEFHVQTDPSHTRTDVKNTATLTDFRRAGLVSSVEPSVPVGWLPSDSQLGIES